MLNQFSEICISHGGEQHVFAETFGERPLRGQGRCPVSVAGSGVVGTGKSRIGWLGNPAQSTMVAAMSDSMPARSKLLFSSHGSTILFCCDIDHSPFTARASTPGKASGVNDQGVKTPEADYARATSAVAVEIEIGIQSPRLTLCHRAPPMV